MNRLLVGDKVIVNRTRKTSRLGIVGLHGQVTTLYNSTVEVQTERGRFVLAHDDVRLVFGLR